jgi:hypothetical protein
VFTHLVLIAFMVTAPTVKNSRSYQKPYDQVWANVVAWFAKNNVAIKAIDRAGGSIYAEGASFDNTVADCGKPGPGLLQPVGRRASFNVFVNHVGSEPTVTVTTQFEEMRASGANRATVVCVSKGVLENLLLSSISK